MDGVLLLGWKSWIWGIQFLLFSSKSKYCFWSKCRSFLVSLLLCLSPLPWITNDMFFFTSACSIHSIKYFSIKLLARFNWLRYTFSFYMSLESPWDWKSLSLFFILYFLFRFEFWGFKLFDNVRFWDFILKFGLGF